MRNEIIGSQPGYVVCLNYKFSYTSWESKIQEKIGVHHLVCKEK